MSEFLEVELGLVDPASDPSVNPPNPSPGPEQQQQDQAQNQYQEYRRMTPDEFRNACLAETRVRHEKSKEPKDHFLNAATSLKWVNMFLPQNAAIIQGWTMKKCTEYCLLFALNETWSELDADKYNSYVQDEGVDVVDAISVKVWKKFHVYLSICRPIIQVVTDAKKQVLDWLLTDVAITRQKKWKDDSPNMFGTQFGTKHRKPQTARINDIQNVVAYLYGLKDETKEKLTVFVNLVWGPGGWPPKFIVTKGDGMTRIRIHNKREYSGLRLNVLDFCIAEDGKTDNKVYAVTDDVAEVHQFLPLDMAHLEMFNPVKRSVRPFNVVREVTDRIKTVTVVKGQYAYRFDYVPNHTNTFDPERLTKWIETDPKPFVARKILTRPSPPLAVAPVETPDANQDAAPKKYVTSFNERPVKKQHQKHQSKNQHQNKPQNERFKKATNQMNFETPVQVPDQKPNQKPNQKPSSLSTDELAAAVRLVAKNLITDEQFANLVQAQVQQ